MGKKATHIIYQDESGVVGTKVKVRKAMEEWLMRKIRYKKWIFTKIGNTP